MTDQPISTRAPTEETLLLQEKFTETIVNQVELMEKLGQTLLTVELAIPGLYASVLALVNGKDAALTQNWALYTTFVCWGGALLLTLGSIIPRKRAVDRTILRQDRTQPHEPIGLEDFFEQTATYKRNLLVMASLFFFAGVFFAAFTVF